MPAFKDLTYQTFGKLFVIYSIGKNKHGGYKWWCHCECGDFVEVSSNSLIRGTTRSCGCGVAEAATKLMTTHGDSRTRLYRIHALMLQRCYNQHNPRYPRYGGRGVSICPDWLEYPAFAQWATTHGYTDTLTIDRINNDGDYSPQNCEWVTIEENVRRRDDASKSRRHS